MTSHNLTRTTADTFALLITDSFLKSGERDLFAVVFTEYLNDGSMVSEVHVIAHSCIKHDVPLLTKSACTSMLDSLNTDFCDPAYWQAQALELDAYVSDSAA